MVLINEVWKRKENQERSRTHGVKNTFDSTFKYAMETSEEMCHMTTPRNKRIEESIIV